MKIFTSEAQRLAVAVRVIALAVLACLGVSWRLWVSDRLYPLVPLFGLVPPLPAPLDRAVLVALVALLAGLVMRPGGRPLLVAVVALLAALFAQDQSRLWPSFYEFFLLLLVLLGGRRGGGEAEAGRVLAGMRFVLAAVYFWSGVQKLTPHFFHDEFPRFVRPLTDLLPVAIPGLPAVAAVAAVAESLIGVGLLTRRFRPLALGEALAMHAFIVACIRPGHDTWNAGAWTWNLATAVLAWVLFREAPPFSWRAMFGGPWLARVPPALVVLLAGIAPVLNSVNRWDSALSFNVYTGNVTAAVVVMPPAVADRLPSEVAAHVSRKGAAAVLDVNAWALATFGGGAYPEERIYRAVFRTVRGLVPDAAMRLVLVEKAGWWFPKAQRVDPCDPP